MQGPTRRHVAIIIWLREKGKSTDTKSFQLSLLKKRNRHTGCIAEDTTSPKTNLIVFKDIPAVLLHIAPECSAIARQYEWQADLSES